MLCVCVCVRTHARVHEQFDREHFSEQFVDMKYLEGKRGSGGGAAAEGDAHSSKKIKQSSITCKVHKSPPHSY